MQYTISKLSSTECKGPQWSMRIEWIVKLSAHLMDFFCLPNDMQYMYPMNLSLLILKYFFLLLRLSMVMHLATWLIWLLLKNSRAIISVQLAVLN